MPNVDAVLDRNVANAVSLRTEDFRGASAAAPAAQTAAAGTLGNTNVYEVFQGKQSTLPLSGTVTTKGGTLTLLFSGTGNVASVSPGSIYILGAILNIDDHYVGQATMWVVDTNVKTLSTAVVVTGIAAGTHSVSITNFKDTVVNNSYNTWNLVILET